MKRKRPHATRQLLRLPIRRVTPLGSGVVFGRLAALTRRGGRGLISLGLGAIMVALIGLLIANFIGQVIQSARLESQRVALEAEVGQLRAANRQLQAAVEYAESDVNVERIAREQLGYARDGDVVILPQISAPTAPAPAPTAPAPAPTAPAPAANWWGWWQAFFPTS